MCVCGGRGHVLREAAAQEWMDLCYQGIRSAPSVKYMKELMHEITLSLEL